MAGGVEDIPGEPANGPDTAVTGATDCEEVEALDSSSMTLCWMSASEAARLPIVAFN